MNASESIQDLGRQGPEFLVNQLEKTTIIFLL
jgi:hypothetical protein